MTAIAESPGASGLERVRDLAAEGQIRCADYAPDREPEVRVPDSVLIEESPVTEIETRL